MALLTVEEAKALLLKGLEWRAQQTAKSEAKLRSDIEA